MNASVSAALLLLLLSGGWLLGRRHRRPFLRSTDTGPVVALNRAQIERLRQRSPAASALEQASPSRPTLPATVVAGSKPELVPLSSQPRMRRQRLQQLQGWLTGSREQRLDVMAVASVSGGRDALPLLRRGLRDPDPAVMAAAAAAMQRFRGRTSPALPTRAPVPKRR